MGYTVVVHNWVARSAVVHRLMAHTVGVYRLMSRTIGFYGLMARTVNVLACSEGDAVALGNTDVAQVYNIRDL